MSADSAAVALDLPVHAAAEHTIDLSKFPTGATFTRILGVDYVHLYTPADGDLYLTPHGVPFWRQLLPDNWYAEDWFPTHRTRLEGTGTVYHLPTRPLEGLRPKSIEVVAKWSRVGEDVPLNTFTLQRAITAEFNTPFEEFSLLESLRRGEYGPANVRILTQKPLAIFVPPERMQLWQTGRSKHKILSKVGRHPAVEIDILRSYIMLYGWVKGQDAVRTLDSICASNAQAQVELQELTNATDAELRAKGFVVADHKPTHVIVRTRNGAIRRRRDGRSAYAVVDYELLARTPEYNEQVIYARRNEYFVRERDRFLPRAPSSFPPHLKPTNMLGVDYVYGTTESTRGRLWVMGNDPELFSFFLPERWRHKQVVMSPKNEVYYVQTKDRIHLLWKVSNVGELPPVAQDNPRYEPILAQGYNSPFEEFAYAAEFSRRGIKTIHPRAIYATGQLGGMPRCMVDPRAFERLATLSSPDGQPLMPPLHDYITIWGYWRGVEDAEAALDAQRWSCVDAGQAFRAGMISESELTDIIEKQRRALAGAGFVDENLRGEHVLLTYIPGGAFRKDERGEVERRHCNFEFVRRV